MGKKVIREKKVLEVCLPRKWYKLLMNAVCYKVIVEKGMKDGQKITFYGEADQVRKVCYMM